MNGGIVPSPAVEILSDGRGEWCERVGDGRKYSSALENDNDGFGE